ncbi:MAG: hypothetical protein NVS4B10_06520 [Myxococcales bacterium]
MRLCLFAGSAAGGRAAYAQAARDLGREVARRGHGLVYGGAATGLMGLCATAALEGGAQVIGVLPRFLRDREIAHPGLTELRTVDTLHERKSTMSALGDAVIALPGGMGTLDELFEAVTWRQLGLHAKPIGLLDADGYYQPLLAFLRGATAAVERTTRPSSARCPTNPAAELLDALGAA